MEVSKRGAYKGRVRAIGVENGLASQTYQPRKWGEDCWARIFSWFGEYELQRKKGMKESQTEKEEMRQQQRMKVMMDMTRKINATRAEWTRKTVGRPVSACATHCKKALLHPEWGITVRRWYTWLFELKKKDEEKRMEVEHPKLVGRMLRSVQDHEANNFDRRSADSEGGRRRCQAVSQM